MSITCLELTEGFGLGGSLDLPPREMSVFPLISSLCLFVDVEME
jgi:hypothetical protein